MNLTLARKTVVDRLKGTVFFGIGLVAYMLLLVSIFPSFKNMPNMEELMDSYPEELLKFFGVESFNLADFNSYMSMEFFGMAMIVILGVYVFTFARSITAGEQRDGSMELLITQPVRRWQIVATKSLVLFAGIAALVLVIFLSIFLFGSVFDVGGLTYKGYLAFMLPCMALFTSIAGIATLFSVLFPRNGIALSVVLTLAMYLVNFMGTTVDSLSWTRYASIFNYYNAYEVISTAQLPWAHLLVLAAVGIGCFSAAAAVFEHRDLVLSLP